MHTSPIVIDLETDRHPDAPTFLELPVADKRLTDPIKIKADLAEKARLQLEKASLDPNTGRVVLITYWTEEEGPCAKVCRDEDTERLALLTFWADAQHRTIVGFNIKSFDLRFLVRRSQLLGVPYPMLDFSPYSRKGVTDLFLELTFNEGHRDQQGVMRHTLKAFCKRFGIDVHDPVDGKDIPALVAAGDWDAVRAHGLSDLALTVQLATRLGVIQGTFDGTPARI